MNDTHDPQLRSWVASANVSQSDFPIQNLPFGIFRRRDTHEQPRVGVAIGDHIVDLPVCAQAMGIVGEAIKACDSPTMNQLMALGADEWHILRAQLSVLLREDSVAYENDRSIRQRILVPMVEADLLLPAAIGDYTDFYASMFHATNVGKLFRPDNPLLPNYKHVPIGYHGRSSSIVASGAMVQRPLGQTKDQQADMPTFGPSKLLDYELEVGAFVGVGNALGMPIPIAQAEQFIFGLCLVNDWSARDIQTWEYQPLGPFLAKSFATTISPWVVTMEALAPFRSPAFERAAEDPQPLPYLQSEHNHAYGSIDITLEVWLASEQMRQSSIAPIRLSHGNFTEMYWTVAQLLTHHASNGCNLRPGDLLASGTVSGPNKEARGCLLELTSRGAEPIELPSGEQRRFLQDGDEIILRGYCEREGAVRIGFGDCRGVVLPATQFENTRP